MSTEIHISSLVVHGRPEGIEPIETAIGALDGAEIHGVSDEGKLVVTLETSDEGEMLSRIEEINRIAGVLSVALVFHQVEEPTDSQ
jgi:nitrate reductase NapD